jgi:hypothetical protein
MVPLIAPLNVWAWLNPAANKMTTANLSNCRIDPPFIPQHLLVMFPRWGTLVTYGAKLHESNNVVIFSLLPKWMTG